jgi:hypothetical protein
MSGAADRGFKEGIMIVSAHSIVRYLERIKDIDIPAMRAEFAIADPQRKRLDDGPFLRWLDVQVPGVLALIKADLLAQCADASDAGASSLKTPECVFCFKNGNLVTVLTHEQLEKKRNSLLAHKSRHLLVLAKTARRI